MPAKWGFVPRWAKDPEVGTRWINIGVESLMEKAVFRHAFKHRRCLVLADGFYTWQQMPNGRQPVYIHLKRGRVFGFAGLYENWTSPQGENVRTCAIITTVANKIVAPMSAQMPVILSRDDESLWLDHLLKDPTRIPVAVRSSAVLDL